jgi:enoyl-CoA hydratase/carnithine racemase
MKASPSAPGLASGEPGARFERRDAAGFIALDAPKALGALMPAMARGVAGALASFERDKRVARAAAAGAGGRACCAGGGGAVAAYFAPLGARESTFPETPR